MVMCIRESERNRSVPNSAKPAGRLSPGTQMRPLPPTTFSREATIWLYLNIPARVGAKQILSF